jgi:CTP:molybdopterin cytidylyltransferase MocA
MRDAVGIVLAAGAGRRFGAPKALAVLDGERLVDRAVRLLRAGGCAPVCVVTGAADVGAVAADVVLNPLWRSGMGSTLQAGLHWAATTSGECAVVTLVDTPWIGAEAVLRLRSTPGHAVQASYDCVPGHPVLLARPVWTDVAELAVGDAGARAWLRANGSDVVRVDCTGTGDPRDVDRPEDLLG